MQLKNKSEGQNSPPQGSDTMSWFDAAGFTSLAKSALKEAQRTIDKALDIEENEENILPPSTLPVSPPAPPSKGMFVNNLLNLKVCLWISC